MKSLTKPRTMLFVLAIVLTAFVFVSQQSAKAQQPIGKAWPVEQQISIDQIDHSEFNSLLKKYVDTDGLVDYEKWKANAADRTALQDYLKHLGRANVKKASERANILAYWINAYNAVTLEGILQVYPTTSIRNHTAKVVGYNIWKNLMLPVGNGTATPTEINLDSIEHKVLRKMNEPRIHFAIVCASIGCPRLLNEAYVGERLEQQLATNTKDFFSRAQNLQLDRDSNKLRLSSILKWFGADFGANDQEVIAAIAPYFPDDAKRFVGATRYKVSYLNYDWNLNVQEK